MAKAFVFGKFLPFHKGHEAMIKFSLTKCDFLTILVCCSDKENISAITRKVWIEKAFQNNKNIEVKTFSYFENELPNTSETSKEISEIWANAFKKLFPDYLLVITSEPYGNIVADFMHIQHIPFDIDKKQFPISASLIRSNLFSNWHFLPDSVKPNYAIKVVILGTESTGKTTLTKKLSAHYNGTFILEAGRDLIPNSKKFSFEDLLLVAQEHAKRIQEAVLGNSPLIIIDTDIHITKSYAQFKFNTKLEVNDDIYDTNKADLYLYLNNDVDYYQDGTRLNEKERNLLDLSHRQVLTNHNINFIEISGNWQSRFEKAVEQIDKIILGYFV